MIRLLFFFFKQKTAYEMRISDWSSDVCSSDLHSFFSPLASSSRRTVRPGQSTALARSRWRSARRLNFAVSKYFGSGQKRSRVPVLRLRSEEHTSELQSLMRISYAVFCLKKKKKNN